MLKCVLVYLILFILHKARNVYRVNLVLRVQIFYIVTTQEQYAVGAYIQSV